MQFLGTTPVGYNKGEHLVVAESAEPTFSINCVTLCDEPDTVLFLSQFGRVFNPLLASQAREGNLFAPAVPEALSQAPI
jgi:hypothetical protein